jgi:hypothetical protein
MLAASRAARKNSSCNVYAAAKVAGDAPAQGRFQRVVSLAFVTLAHIEQLFSLSYSSAEAHNILVKQTRTDKLRLEEKKLPQEGKAGDLIAILGKEFTPFNDTPDQCLNYGSV